MSDNMIRPIVLYKPYGNNDVLTHYIDEKDYSDSQKRHEVHEILESNRIHYNGLGLAANQIGLEERAFNIDGSTYFNPNVVEYNRDSVDAYSEGCLSFLSIKASIYRPHEITVNYTNLEGEVVNKTLEGLDAVAFQHELDHLNGITMADNIKSKIQRKKFMEKYKKSFNKLK